MLRVFQVALLVLFFAFACAPVSPAPRSAWLDVSQAPYNVHPQKQTPAQVTLALNRALRDAASSGHGQTVYLPDGIYTLNAPLEVKGALRGQSRTRTILRLAPSTRAFGDRLHPRSVVSLRGAPSQKSLGTCVGLSDLSIEVEERNGGAVGVRLAGTVSSVVRRVSLRGDGSTGLDCEAPKTGFSLVQDVSVEGFDCGVESSPGQGQGQSRGAAMFERLQLQLQHEVGFRNGTSTALVRDLRSRNRVCALQNGGGFVVLDIARLIGAGSVGLDNAGGQLVLRAVRCAGYNATLRDGERLTTGDIAEYVSPKQVFRASGYVARAQLDGARSLRLPEHATPEAPLSSPDDWVNVANFGAKAGDESDDSGAIQRAIDSLSDPDSPSFGKTTLFFPRPSAGSAEELYLVSHPILLRGNLARIEGNGATFGVCGTLSKDKGAVFVVDEVTRGQIWIADFRIDGHFSGDAERSVVRGNNRNTAGSVEVNVSEARRKGPQQTRSGLASKRTFAKLAPRGENPALQTRSPQQNPQCSKFSRTLKTTLKNRSGLVFVEHRSNTMLIARDIQIREISLYRALPGAGDVFLENAIGHATLEATALIFERGQNVWARGVHLEGFSCALLNLGARVWMMGLGVQNGATAIDNAGDCEIVGLEVESGANEAVGVSVPGLLINREGGRLWTTALFYRHSASPEVIVLEDEDQGDCLRSDALPRRGDKIVALSLRAGE